MPIPDIKDAGIVAGFGLWGWPYHGLCSAGVIACAGGVSKTIVTPAHGSAWLYDLGLPAITRTPAEIIADTALGHEWRNYTMISGGAINGTQIEQIGSDSFVHVDASGVPWLIRMVYSYPNLASQRVRITFSVVRFGLFGEGVKTPVQVVKDVQCHYITYSIYGYSYEGYETTLEDVWTNGSKALVSVGRTRSSTPPLKDLFSLLEVTFSGSGGVDGSGLVINVAEIRDDTQLSQGVVFELGGAVPVGITEVPGSRSWQSSGGAYYAQWDNNPVVWIPGWGSSEYDGVETSTFARYAYYDASGAARVAKIRKKYEVRSHLLSSGSGSYGSIYQAIECVPSAVTWNSDACLWTTAAGLEEHTFGIYLLEDDQVIDYLELYQNQTITKFLRDPRTNLPSIPGIVVSCDIFSYDPGRIALANDNVINAWGTPTWRGTLASSISLPAPPTMETNEWSRYIPPLSVDDLILVWRAKDTNYETSGSAVVAGTALLGVQRIDAKAAAFYAPGSARTYGNILTPLGVKTTAMTPAGNLYFAWQRKTADFTFDTVPICYV